MSVYDSDTVTKLFASAGIAQLRRKGLRCLSADDHGAVGMLRPSVSFFMHVQGSLHGHFEC